LEIRNQEFRKALRGLDPVEVQTFLEMVSEHYEEILEENKTLSRRIVELETRLQDFQENEKNLRETLLNVQEVKKQSEESSRRQADLIIKEAEIKAMEVVETARKQTRQIREEVNWLKSQKESFINRLRHILVSQIELLSVMEIDDVLPAETQDLLKNLKARKYGQLNPSEEAVEPPAREEEPEVIEEAAEIEFDEEYSKNSEIDEDIKDAKDNEIIAEEPEPAEEEFPEGETRLIQRMNSSEIEEVPAAPKKDKKKKDESSLSDDDINDFFKKGIQIDELIKTINKKEFDK
jgi:cell division initiation protein